MSNFIRIALIGDYRLDVPAHVAIPRTIELAASDLNCAFELTWIRTDSPELRNQQSRTLDSYDGIWCVPGSPYASMDGALHAITFARQHLVPFLVQTKTRSLGMW